MAFAWLVQSYSDQASSSLAPSEHLALELQLALALVLVLEPEPEPEPELELELELVSEPKHADQPSQVELPLTPPSGHVLLSFRDDLSP